MVVNIQKDKSTRLYDILYSWQKTIVDKVIHRNRFGLFLNMGTGKTLISLTLCQENDIKKILVVSLKTKVLEDKDLEGSFDYWLDKMNFNIYKKSPKNELKLVSEGKSNHHSIIVNYEGLKSKDKGNKLQNWLLEFIQNSKGEKIGLILDESHRVKNPSSQISKIIKYLIEELNSRCKLTLYLLTGTPWTQGMIDLQNQLSLLGSKQTRTEFISNYGIRGKIPGLYEWQQPIVGYKNLTHLFDEVRKYAITMKTNPELKLPEQIHTNIISPKSIEFDLFTSKNYKKELIKNYLKKFRNLEIDLTNISNPLYRNFSYPNDEYFAETPGSFWLRSRQLSIGFLGNSQGYVWYNRDRLDRLEIFLQNNKNNYIIFYSYTPELNEIFEICKKLGYLIDIYCGDIKDLKNYEEYDENSLDMKKRVILTNYQSGSVGKNWQKYHNTIFFSTPLYGLYSQALSRTHRIGQKSTTYYYYFYQDNFLDNGMLQSLKKGEEYDQKLFMSQLEDNGK